jgi:hypothetical protein
VRTVLRERLSEGIASQVVQPQAGMDYALASATGSSPYRLERTDLATGSVRPGQRFPVSGLSLAAGYLWVFGNVPSQSTSFRLVLYQVNPKTLAVIRFRLLAPRRTAVSDGVALTAGPGRTVWVGFERTLLRLDTGTGATVGRITLPRGTILSDVRTDPARRRLYVAAQVLSPDVGMVLEYGAVSGLLLASDETHPLPSVGGAALTAVPDGVWASFRTGMMGQTVLLRRTGLSSVPLSGGIYGWPMHATTVYGGGALWLANDNNAVGCIAPDTGVVRHQRTLAELGGTGELLAVNAVSQMIYALGEQGVIAITPPRGCWR